MPFLDAYDIAKLTLESLGKLKNPDKYTNKANWSEVCLFNNDLIHAEVESWPEEFSNLLNFLHYFGNLDYGSRDLAHDLLLRRYAKLGGMPELASWRDGYSDWSNESLRLLSRGLHKFFTEDNNEA